MFQVETFCLVRLDSIGYGARMLEFNKTQTEFLAQELRELKILIQTNNKQAMKQRKK